VSLTAAASVLGLVYPRATATRTCLCCLEAARSALVRLLNSWCRMDLWWNDATKRCDWPCQVQCSKEIFDDEKNAAAIRELDRDNCEAPAVMHSTVLPGYGRK